VDAEGTENEAGRLTAPASPGPEPGTSDGEPVAPGRPAEPGGAGEHEEERPPLLPMAITIVGILLMAGFVALIPPLRDAAEFAIKGDTAALRAELDGAAGVITLFVLAILHSFVFYPAEILNAAAGFVWGFWLGLVLVMIGWMMNAYVAYEIGRHGARPLLYRIFGRHRFLILERAIERGGIVLLFAVRLIPIVPFSLFTIVAGAAHVPLWRLMWTTAIAYIPLTALFVYFGTQLEEFDPNNPILIAGAGLIVVVIWIGHRMRHRLLDEPEKEAQRT
jgi:uncharacterized membrane protein YdjX (TVP38/TMEM64 family)